MHTATCTGSICGGRPLGECAVSRGAGTRGWGSRQLLLSCWGSRVRVCVRAHVCTSMCTCVCTCVRACARTCVCPGVCVHARMCVYIHACTCVCVHVRAHVYVQVYMCACVCAHARVYICVRVFVHVYRRVRMHVCICACACSSVCACAHVYVHVYMWACACPCVHTCACVCACACMHVYMCVCTHSLRSHLCFCRNRCLWQPRARGLPPLQVHCQFWSLEELTHPVFVSHTPWGCLLARAGSVHLPHVAQRGQAQEVVLGALALSAGSGGAVPGLQRCGVVGHTDTPRAALCSAPPLPVWSRRLMVCSMMWWVVRVAFSCPSPHVGGLGG